MKGRPFKRELAEIGESIWYCKSKSKGRTKLVSRWGTGVYLGVRDESCEYIIGTDDGITKCRTIRRKGT